MDWGPPGFSVHALPRQEQESGLPFPSPGDLPDPGIEPTSPAFQADSLPAELFGRPNVRPHRYLKFGEWIHHKAIVHQKSL